MSCARLLCIAALFLTLLPDALGTTAQRTFVSSAGSDAAACSITAPCRGLTAAVGATSSKGEVVVLDSAGYGGATVTQAVSIVAPPGVYAGVSVFSGTGITIMAGATDKVVLRGLAVNGQGGFIGVQV